MRTWEAARACSDAIRRLAARWYRRRCVERYRRSDDLPQGPAGRTDVTAMMSHVTLGHTHTHTHTHRERERERERETLESLVGPASQSAYLCTHWLTAYGTDDVCCVWSLWWALSSQCRASLSVRKWFIVRQYIYNIWFTFRFSSAQEEFCDI